MTLSPTEIEEPSVPSSVPATEPRNGRRLSPLAVAGAAGLIVGIIGVIMAIAWYGAGEGDWETSDMGVQGQSDVPMVDDGARLQRRIDGVSVDVAIPTPAPGSYEYPTGDMVPPWAEPHPAVSSGAYEAPEVFTLWLFAFNEPSQCTDDCDLDDLAVGAAARGGSYQLDGRIGDDDTLAFAGTVRLGQPSLNGAPLDNPRGAEIHVAIAPHGRVLPGEAGWRQLNGPIGNPSLWWAASFIAGR